MNKIQGFTAAVATAAAAAAIDKIIDAHRDKSCAYSNGHSNDVKRKKKKSFAC